MPRRYVDYPDAFAFWNKVSSFGYLIALAGVVVFLVMLAEAGDPSAQGGGQSLGRRRDHPGVDPAPQAAPRITHSSTNCRTSFRRRHTDADLTGAGRRS